MKDIKFRKGFVLGIIFLFVGAGVIPSTGTTVENTTFTAIKSSSYIQNLIDNASDGDTIYIPSGIYYENIEIDKSIDLIGEDKNTTIIDGSRIYNTVSISDDWVNISNFTIQNGSGSTASRHAGILIYSSHCTITNNIITDNKHGLILSNYDYNTVAHNIISNNDLHGLLLLNSIGNTIIDNLFFNRGIYIYDSPYHASCHNIIKCNMINSKPLVYLENESDLIISDAGQVLLVECNNIKVENSNLSNIFVGIGLWDSKNCQISNNNFSNNILGIEITESNRTNITDNYISYNNYGIHLRYSNFNSIKNNDIISNSDDGIYFYKSKFNTIFDNFINNNDIGIEFSYKSRFNTIKNNNILNNDEGILLIDTFLGSFLEGSTFNLIIKNNFIDNDRDAFFRNSRINRWSQNYWNETQTLPKLIFGELFYTTLVGLGFIPHHIPWIPQIDWRPAKEPYDI